MSTNYQEKEARTVLNNYKHVDSWFWCKYSVNPYEGCEHACEYCDARSHKYHFHEDFEQTIYAKTNAPEILRKQIAKKPKDIVAFSGVTDPYQPAEGKYEITKNCLKVLSDLGFPAFIGTKSDLVLRDLDLLREINDKSSALVEFTVTTFNKEHLKNLEPHATSSEDRLKALSKIAAAGIPAGVSLMPIVPYVLDNEENIEEVVRRSKEAGAQYVLVAGMTMRDRQQERFFSLLKEKYPGLEEKYQELYKGKYNADHQYYSKLMRLCQKILEKYDMPSRSPRPVKFFSERLHLNKRVAEALHYKTYKMEMGGEEHYKIWAFREAAWAVDELKEEVQLIYKAMGKKGLLKIPGVGEDVATYITKIMKAIRTSQ